MKTEKNKKISIASIIFYVVAVIFLLIGAFFIYLTYESVAAYVAQGSTPTLESMMSAYLSNSAPYFAYAFILYGVGVLLQKFAATNQILASCMEEVVECETDDTEGAVFEDIQKELTVEEETPIETIETSEEVEEPEASEEIVVEESEVK